MNANDRYLRCPRCEHREWVSPEDEDASLSLMVGHGRSQHPDMSDRDMLAGAELVDEDGQLAEVAW